MTEVQPGCNDHQTCVNVPWGMEAGWGTAMLVRTVAIAVRSVAGGHKDNSGGGCSDQGWANT